VVEVRSLNAGVLTSAAGWRRSVVGITAVCAVLLFAGCSTKPTSSGDEAKELSSKADPLSEYMSRAQAAEAAEGGRERARLIYRDAAKTYPTDKRPWLRLAQSYFDTADYGNAVLAAQEVVQRDPTDNVSQGLLAVSGLRISTAALSALRSQNNLTTSTRTEAEDMARNLRAVLGETVLVPKPADPVHLESRPQPRAQTQPKPQRPKPRVAPAAAAASAPVVPPSAPSNPFGALK